MKWRRHNSGCSVLKVVLFVTILGLGRPAKALEQVTFDDLQAAMRTLSFLESLPREGPIVVGVVYASDTPGSQSKALESANAISDLEKFGGRLDVILLGPGVSRQPDRIVGAMGRLHPVSISDDPLCMEAGCCVLLVRTGQQVEISLNTSLADAIGAHFSLVFMMVVKRR
jgi:hypothetical protein